MIRREINMNPGPKEAAWLEARRLDSQRVTRAAIGRTSCPHCVGYPYRKLTDVIRLEPLSLEMKKRLASVR